MRPEEDFDISFLDPKKLKESEAKIESGEITCNIEAQRTASPVVANKNPRSEEQGSER